MIGRPNQNQPSRKWKVVQPTHVAEDTAVALLKCINTRDQAGLVKLIETEPDIRIARLLRDKDCKLERHGGVLPAAERSLTGLCVEFGWGKAIGALAKAGDAFTPQQPSDETPLLQATRLMRASCVKALLVGGASDRLEDGTPILTRACAQWLDVSKEIKDSRRIVRAFMDSGSDLWALAPLETSAGMMDRPVLEHLLVNNNIGVAGALLEIAPVPDWYKDQPEQAWGALGKAMGLRLQHNPGIGLGGLAMPILLGMVRDFADAGLDGPVDIINASGPGHYRGGLYELRCSAWLDMIDAILDAYPGQRERYVKQVIDGATSAPNANISGKTIARMERLMLEAGTSETGATTRAAPRL